MKSFVFLVLMLPLFAFKADSIDNISKAMSAGDAITLGNYMDNNVELTILNKQAVYSKSDAVRQMQQFFASNKPAGFNQMHQGTSKGIGAKYCIGNLKTNATTYRVYIFLDASSNTHKIQELRIEK